MSTLVGKEAPNFNASAVLHDGTICQEYNLYKNIDNKYGLLFFYPLDFTFVCPSELIYLNNKITELQERQVETIDTLYGSEDLLEGQKAFSEKRDPIWRGK